ncbi:MAG TPA: tetratricopeptide repeat protein, partial [Burkholderiaceae bacterium]
MSKSLLQRWFGRADDAPAPLLPQAQEAQEQKSLGDVLLGQGDHAGAEARYRAAIAAAPGFAPAHTNLAYALHRQGRSGDAAEALRRSHGLDEAQADAHYLSAALAVEALRPDDAERHYRRALEIDPALEAASLELGALLAQQGRLADAVTAVEHGLAQHPGSTQLHFYLGNLHHEQGQYEAAIAAFHKAESGAPDSAALLNNLGLALIKLNDPARADETRAIHERLARLAPESAEAHNNLGLA